MSTATTTTSSPLARFVAEQKRIAVSLLDPSNQLLGTVAILGGVVSALALSKLYINLTEVEEESPESIIAGRGLTAMMLGVGYVWWELNKAQYGQYEETSMLAVAEDMGMGDEESELT